MKNDTTCRNKSEITENCKIVECSTPVKCCLFKTY